MKTLLISRQFRVANYDCDTMIIKFRDVDGAWGFDYPEGIYQEFRLEANLYNPKYKEKSSEYRQQDGVYRNGAAYIDKQFDLITNSNFDEPTHDALAVALRHRECYINGKAVFRISAYDVAEYDVILKTAQAKTVVVEQAYNKTNIFCDT